MRAAAAEPSRACVRACLLVLSCLVLRFLLWPIYSIRRVTFHPCETQSAISHSFPFQSRCFLSIPVPNLCAHRDRESRPPEPDALHRDTCSGVRAIRFLGSVFRDCSPARSSSSTPVDRDRDRLHLLPGGHLGLRLLHLLPGGRSRDCTANIFRHQLRSTTMSNTLCRLV